ncbi:hypothetical protein, partial [Sessilibacter sp. MAH4]
MLTVKLLLVLILMSVVCACSTHSLYSVESIPSVKAKSIHLDVDADPIKTSHIDQIDTPDDAIESSSDENNKAQPDLSSENFYDFYIVDDNSSLHNEFDVGIHNTFISKEKKSINKEIRSKPELSIGVEDSSKKYNQKDLTENNSKIQAVEQ